MEAYIYINIYTQLKALIKARSGPIVSVQSVFLSCDFIQYLFIDSLKQDCSNSTANALELPQSCTKPLVYSTVYISIFYSHSVVIVAAPLSAIQQWGRFGGRLGPVSI